MSHMSHGPVYFFVLCCVPSRTCLGGNKKLSVVAARCQILRQKFTKFDFGWVSMGVDPQEKSGVEGGPD